MSRKMQTSRPQRRNTENSNAAKPLKNKAILLGLLKDLCGEGELFTKDSFHGNIKWRPEQLACEALLWSWQSDKLVTDAFEVTLEVCADLKLDRIAHTYTSFMNALDRYRPVFSLRLNQRLQALAEDIGGRYFRTDHWVLIGFDGSRVTLPRSIANEKAFCAPNYGRGKRAKYGKKKSKGMRRKQNEKHKPHPQKPQAWVTMMWHMGLRLPWSWRLGPSNSSERGHVQEMLSQESFPKETLFCGDAGFVGYPLWSSVLAAGADFLVRVGANVKLLSEHADIKPLRDGMVLCWPKGQMQSGGRPLRLRLVRVKVGKTQMWLLTSVRSATKLSKRQIVKYYKMRWGIEIEFRGLKQTVDKHKLRCRNSDRALVELDWSIRAMAMAELLALREQIPKQERRQTTESYDPKQRSLASTMRGLRASMRNRNETPANDNLLIELSRALVQQYKQGTDKRARYRPKNDDKKPLGDPDVRTITVEERKKLRELTQNQAA